MSYYVYIMTNRAGTLYTGVTNDLERRVAEHRAGTERGFAAKYKTDRLVYYDETDDIDAAIAGEKQIKGWLRRKKVELIESMNPLWFDLAEEWNSQEQILRFAQNDKHPTMESRQTALRLVLQGIRGDQHGASGPHSPGRCEGGTLWTLAHSAGSN